ncbi:hypothetical protein ACVWZ3_003726 [Bradyrhizobium sp. i1.3.6]
MTRPRPTTHNCLSAILRWGGYHLTWCRGYIRMRAQDIENTLKYDLDAGQADAWPEGSVRASLCPLQVQATVAR